jgi:HD-GYP domain-containing protein (c-di-GMP phosphodiesterase class II)
MELAELPIPGTAELAITRRKLHEAALLISGDAQVAARIAGDFSDIARTLLEACGKISLHLGLVRNGAARSLHFDCIVPQQPPPHLAATQIAGSGWSVTRAHPIAGGWIEQATIDRARGVLLQKSREELLVENNDLLRRTLSARTASLNRLAIEFGSIQDLDTLLARMLDEARGVFRCEAGSILLPENGKLRFRHASNESSNSSERLLASTTSPVLLPIDHASMAGAAALEGMVVVRDAYDLPPGVPYQFNRTIDKVTGFRTRAVLSVAMRSSQGELLGVLQLINPRTIDGGASEFDTDDQKLAVHFAGMAAMAIERSSMTRALVLRMMRLAELRDPKETGAHVRRVAEVAVRLYLAWARRKGLSEETIYQQVDHLRPAAMLHDVGKVGIADAILKKPGKLDPNERMDMEKHSRIGAETLLGVKTAMDQRIREVTLYHHARWDGTGYPRRAEIVETLQHLGIDTTNIPEPRGEGIPLAARIVAIADVFDALMSRRAYKEAWSPAEVQEEFRRSAGSHFDPELVELFLADFDEHCRIHAAIQDEARKAGNS